MYRLCTRWTAGGIDGSWSVGCGPVGVYEVYADTVNLKSWINFELVVKLSKEKCELIKISFVHFYRYFNRHLCSRPDFTRFDSVRVENGAKKSQKVAAFTRIEIVWKCH